MCFEPPSSCDSRDLAISSLHLRRDRRKAVLRFAALHYNAIIARLSLLRIIYHGHHVPQALLQRLREVHRVGAAVAVKSGNREHETVAPHVVRASVAIRHHRPVSGDHVVLCGHLQDQSHLYLKLYTRDM